MTDDLVEILLVEDNPSDVKLALHALQRHHVANRVQVVRDGEEAIDYLFGTGTFQGRDPKGTPKVVLLDLKLPKISGLDVLRKIKSDPITRMIPVVVLTTSREDTDVQASYELGVNSYIVKPVDFDQFSESVRELGLYWVLLNHAPKLDL